MMQTVVPRSGAAHGEPAQDHAIHFEMSQRGTNGFGDIGFAAQR